MKETLVLFAKLLEAFIDSRADNPKAIAKKWLDIVHEELEVRE